LNVSKVELRNISGIRNSIDLVLKKCVMLDLFHPPIQREKLIHLKNLLVKEKEVQTFTKEIQEDSGK